MSKARTLLNELNSLDEHIRVEAKLCANKLDKSVLESVCSFSNEPDLDGGTIIIGISEDSTSKEIYSVAGIGTMRRLLKEAKLMPPTFESDTSRNIFTTRILLHHFLSEDDLKWLSSLSINNLTDAQKVATSDQKVATPESQKVATSEQKVATPKSQKVATSEQKVATSDQKVATPKSPKVATSTSFGDEILQKLQFLGKRTNKNNLENIIVEMCSAVPLSIEDIANYTNRNINYIRNKILPSLIKEKRITYTFPEMINHPNQKYTAK